MTEVVDKAKEVAAEKVAEVKAVVSESLAQTKEDIKEHYADKKTRWHVYVFGGVAALVVLLALLGVTGVL